MITPDVDNAPLCSVENYTLQPIYVHWEMSWTYFKTDLLNKAVAKYYIFF